MRTVAVLLLVLAVLGGLAFLLFSDGDTGTGVMTPDAPRVTQTTPGDGSRTDLTASGVRRTAEPVEPTRVADDIVAQPEEKEVFKSGVYGLVVDDATGDPIEGAEVRLAYSDGFFLGEAGAGIKDPDRRTKTDANGAYEIANLAPSNHYIMYVSHEDYTTATVSSVIVKFGSELSQEPDVRLEKGVGLTGTVTDQAGNPIMGCEITLGNDLFNPRVAKRNQRTAVTDDRGYYEILNVPGGMFTYMAVADGYAAQVLSGFAFDGKTARQRDIVLKFADGLAGTIVDTQGEGVKDATVTAVRHRNSRLSCRDTWVTEADGGFELGHLEEGEYTILVTAEGYEPGRLNQVATGRNDILIELTKSATVSGVVMGGGSPLPSGKVLLREVMQGTDITNPTDIQGKIKAGGKFELVGVPPGEYCVEGSSIDAGFAPTFSAAFTVEKGVDKENVRIDCTKGATVTGIIMDGDGKPIAGAVVSTEDRMGYLPGWPTNIIPQKVKSGTDGIFELQALKAETYRINVEAEGFVKWTKQNVVVAAQEEKDLGPIRLSRGGTVTGFLQDQTGTGISGGQVFLRLSDSGVVPRRYMEKSKTDGAYEFANVEPGNYLLWSVPIGPDGNPRPMVPGSTKAEVKVYVSDNQVVSQNLTLDMTQILQRPDPKDPKIRGEKGDKERGGR